MNKTIFDNSNVTANSKQIAQLKKNFPQCFDKHGAFIPEKMQDLVSAGGSDFSKESYGLNWLGKSYARLLANENPRTLLSEDKEHNAKPENKASDNLLIKGDNLEVLKHLVNAYSEQVKMIYIDPPYNTGSDGFVYQDDRKFDEYQLSQLAGIDRDEAKRILAFTQSKANSHSAWLTFMYPRLYVARELLKDDGVIFISIDDNEVAQLKMLCDEVFGEQNFLAKFVWKRRSSSALADKNISIDHEYVICYQKGMLQGFVGYPKDFKNYSNLDGDPRGEWVLGDLTVGMTAAMRPNQAYELVDPKTGNSFSVNSSRVWAFIPETMNKMIEEGRVVFPADPTKRPMQKRFRNELKKANNPCSSLILNKVGLNTEGTKIIQSIFGGSVFDYSKPISLLRTLCSQVSNNEETLILDFFAGSGTTAHAVMQLNAKDGGSRRCISVQIDEPTDKKSEAYKAGYKTIFEITKARIEKAAIIIKEKHPNYEGDVGFKIFETKALSDAYLDDIPTLSGEQQALPMMSNNVDDMLTTWEVYDGIALTQNLEKVDLAAYTAYQHDKVCYLMHSGFSSKALVAFLQKLDDTENTFEIEKLVVNGVVFDSKYQREIAEAITQYKNKKDKHISVEFRY